MFVDCFNQMLATISRNALEMQDSKEQLEREVLARTAQLREAQRALVQTARHAGMAEIANGLLHNLGNTLNSVNVAIECAIGQVQESEAVRLGRVIDLLLEHRQSVDKFLSRQKCEDLLSYLEGLSKTLFNERVALLGELKDLARGVEHIKAIVNTQQAYAGMSSILEPVQPKEVIEDALAMNAEALARHRVRVVRELADLPAATWDRYKVLQILFNLITNAKQALSVIDDHERTITVRLEDAGSERFRISVIDNGVGMNAAVLRKLFSHGFTTKRDSHGFGLHSSALTAQSMGGSLTASSPGIGSGATFVLELPQHVVESVEAEGRHESEREVTSAL